MSISLNDEPAAMKADEEDNMDIAEEKPSIEEDASESSNHASDDIKEDDVDEEDNNNDEELIEDIAKISDSVDYGTILSFFDKFSKYLALRDMNVFKNFETAVVAKATRKFFAIFVILILKL